MCSDMHGANGNDAARGSVSGSKRAICRVRACFADVGTYAQNCVLIYQTKGSESATQKLTEPGGDDYC